MEEKPLALEAVGDGNKNKLGYKQGLPFNKAITIVL